MKTFKNIVVGIIIGILLSVMALYGIDREVARRDWNNDGYTENCIFDTNCEHFNELED